MKQLNLNDLSKNIGKEVELHGWVNTIRNHKKIVFIDLRDSTGFVQVVSDEKAAHFSPEDVVSIKGLVKKRPEHMVNDRTPNGDLEIEAKEVMLVSKSQTLPFDMAKENLGLTLPVLLDYRTLTLKHASVKKIFEVHVGSHPS